MSTLLLELHGNMSLNRTIFPPYLFIYDDLLVYRKRRLISVREITISYSQISQVTLNKGIFFAALDIITTGTDDISIRYILRGTAAKAKRIIDQKMYRAHAKHQPENLGEKTTFNNYERSLLRLKELMAKGHISKSEFEKKKAQFLKQMR